MEGIAADVGAAFVLNVEKEKKRVLKENFLLLAFMQSFVRDLLVSINFASFIHIFNNQFIITVDDASKYQLEKHKLYDS